MKETPILFSGPMVRAILEGRKTMTRRVIKPQPSRSVTDWTMDAEEDETVMYRGWPHRLEASRGRNKRDAGELTPRKVACPYGQPGDRLWVRETWDFRSCGDGKVRIAFGAGGLQVERTPPPGWNPMVYNYERWRPSIHMPRWASRLTLEITAVRVERVQDISDTDAECEGCDGADMVPGYSINQFHELWDSINAVRGYGWDVNPWVWVVEFKQVEGKAQEKP